MAMMKKGDNLSYLEGDRQAGARQATLEQDSSVITLESGARVWDAGGATSADVIHMNQASDSFTADGHVTSSQVQNKKNPSSGLLTGDEPVQATAQRMVSTNHNAFIGYEGKAELQQSVPGRTRTGTGEHAEYFVSEDKVLLRGGGPLLVDSLKGNTRGVELTYFTTDDRLLVNGAPEKPATSRLRKK